MFKRINVQQAQSLLSQASTQCVDIRDARSFQQGHIKNAFSLNNHNIEQWLSTANKQHAVIVCCYHGISSQNAAAFIAEQGFIEVYSLDGGFEAWQQQTNEL